jgi:hypothetical protein
MSETPDPQTKDQLIAALEDVHREVADYFGSLPRDDFFRRPAVGVWSPAENLIHLVKSVKAVASGLGMPKLVLRVTFGASKAPSRTFAGLRQVYRDRLSRGARATGPYVPPVLDVADETAAEATRSRILAGWDGAGRSLVEKLRRWSEKSLDRLRLPHPLLGKLTVREMAFFTLFHDRHHLTSVRDRRTPPPS